MFQKLTLFERFLLLTIGRALVIAGIPAKYRESLCALLYKIGFEGEIKAEDLNFFS